MKQTYIFNDDKDISIIHNNILIFYKGSYIYLLMICTKGVFILKKHLQ